MRDINTAIDEYFPVDSPVVFFHAHPDDESFLSAGLLNELSRRGRECIIIYGAAAIVEGQKDSFVRQLEAKKATELLGIFMILFMEFSEPRYLGVGGAVLKNQNPEYAGERLKALLSRHNIRTPFVFVSYDKNGGYGNIDHLAVHEIGRKFYSTYGNHVSHFYEVTINSDGMHDWLVEAKGRLDSRLLPELSYWSPEFGLTEQEITHCYELSDTQIEMKRAALAAHQSQIRIDEFPLSLSKLDFQHVFGREYLMKVDSAGPTHPGSFFKEIERKFLIRVLPSDLEHYSKSEIEQGYISISKDGSEERVRRKGNLFFFTEKSVGKITRGTRDESITKEKYSSYWPLTVGKRIHKTRYELPYGRFVIELDVFHGELEGFAMVEVEFSNEQEAKEFMPPLWFGSDVTADSRYRNQSLATMGIPRKA
ncbi:MAG: PIG-L family deacetylase [Candidatus Roizmanbacteria bacterium]|nr:PIG-L family deacetylase [Candidatus Roizmanbacteria bacterium]